MARWIALAAALMAYGYRVVDADAKARVRPANASVKPPPKLPRIKLPAGLQREPPAARWWEGAAPCPDGELRNDDFGGGIRHRCVDASGADDGPFTEVGSDGKTMQDGWRKHGRDHGLKREFHGGSPYEAKLYVDGLAHGPATESRGAGPYFKGLRSGLWKMRTDGGGQVQGYYVADQRQGVWLATDERDGEVRVVGRATYRNDTITGEVLWWTEPGDLLAVIKRDYAGTSWTLHSPSGKNTQFVGCLGDHVVTMISTKPTETLRCYFDLESGDLAKQDGKGTCPRSIRNAPVDESQFCAGDLLDPWALTNAMRRAGMLR